MKNSIRYERGARVLRRFRECSQSVKPLRLLCKPSPSARDLLDRLLGIASSAAYTLYISQSGQLCDRRIPLFGVLSASRSCSARSAELRRASAPDRFAARSLGILQRSHGPPSRDLSVAASFPLWHRLSRPPAAAAAPPGSSLAAAGQHAARAALRGGLACADERRREHRDEPHRLGSGSRGKNERKNTIPPLKRFLFSSRFEKRIRFLDLHLFAPSESGTESTNKGLLFFVFQKKSNLQMGPLSTSKYPVNAPSKMVERAWPPETGRAPLIH